MQQGMASKRKSKGVEKWLGTDEDLKLKPNQDLIAQKSCEVRAFPVKFNRRIKKKK